MSASAPRRSWPKVGSSRQTTSRCSPSTEATDRRRCWPPESRKGFASARSTRSKRASISSTARSTRASSAPSRRMPWASSSRTVGSRNWCSGFCMTRVTALPGRPGRRGLPATVTSPTVHASRPASALRSVDLPEPLIPTTARTSPRLRVRCTPWSTSWRRLPRPRGTERSWATRTGSSSWAVPSAPPRGAGSSAGAGRVGSAQRADGAAASSRAASSSVSGKALSRPALAAVSPRPVRRWCRRTAVGRRMPAAARASPWTSKTSVGGPVAMVSPSASRAMTRSTAPMSSSRSCSTTRTAVPRSFRAGRRA